MEMSVVKAEEREGSLYITVQAPSMHELASNKARKLAFDERGKHGYETAGIEPSGGPFPVSALDPEKEYSREELQKLAQAKQLVYRQTYRLIRGFPG